MHFHFLFLKIKLVLIIFSFHFIRFSFIIIFNTCNKQSIYLITLNYKMLLSLFNYYIITIIPLFFLKFNAMKQNICMHILLIYYSILNFSIGNYRINIEE